VVYLAEGRMIAMAEDLKEVAMIEPAYAGQLEFQMWSAREGNRFKAGCSRDDGCPPENRGSM